MSSKNCQNFNSDPQQKTQTNNTSKNTHKHKIPQKSTKWLAKTKNPPHFSTVHVRLWNKKALFFLETFSRNVSVSRGGPERSQSWPSPSWWSGDEIQWGHRKLVHRRVIKTSVCGDYARAGSFAFFVVRFHRSTCFVFVSWLFYIIIIVRGVFVFIYIHRRCLNGFCTERFVEGGLRVRSAGGSTRTVLLNVSIH